MRENMLKVACMHWFNKHVFSILQERGPKQIINCHGSDQCLGSLRSSPRSQVHGKFKNAPQTGNCKLQPTSPSVGRLKHTWSRPAVYSSQGISGPPFISVNKVLLEYSHTHSFTCCAWCFSLNWQKWVALTETLCHAKPKMYLWCVPLQERFADLDLNNQVNKPWINGISAI